MENDKQIISKSNNLFSLAPRSLQEAMDYAKLIAQSGMVPQSFQGKPADVLVAVQMGAELGLPPTQALQNIAVINGRPSLWGDAVLAICKGSPLCEYVRERWDDKTNTATCIAKRRGDDEEVVRTFSFDDANRAGLLNRKGPWSQYPQRMAAMRARSWAVRDAFPDLLRGISVREEQQDVIEKDITPTSANPNSRRDEILGLIQDKEPNNQTEEQYKEIDTKPDTENNESEGFSLPPNPEHDFKNISVSIKSCISIEELNELSGACSKLPDEYKKKARKEYSARRDEILQEMKDDS